MLRSFVLWAMADILASSSSPRPIANTEKKPSLLKLLSRALLTAKMGRRRGEPVPSGALWGNSHSVKKRGAQSPEVHESDGCDSSDAFFGVRIIEGGRDISSTTLSNFLLKNRCHSVTTVTFDLDY